MAEVGLGCTDLPTVWTNCVEHAFDAERYYGDAVVPVALEEALVETLQW